MIVLEPILTTFEASVIFWCSWGSSRNWLEPQDKQPLRIWTKLSLSKFVKSSLFSQLHGHLKINSRPGNFSFIFMMSVKRGFIYLDREKGKKECCEKRVRECMSKNGKCLKSLFKALKDELWHFPSDWTQPGFFVERAVSNSNFRPCQKSLKLQFRIACPFYTNTLLLWAWRNPEKKLKAKKSC